MTSGQEELQIKRVLHEEEVDTSNDGGSTGVKTSKRVSRLLRVSSWASITRAQVDTSARRQRVSERAAQTLSVLGQVAGLWVLAASQGRSSRPVAPRIPEMLPTNAHICWKGIFQPIATLAIMRWHDIAGTRLARR